MTIAYEGSTGMLIRKPVAQVFEAIVDPKWTTRFWFTRSTGRLEKGKTVTWSWEMYGVSAQVNVLELEPNERVLIEWGAPGQMTQVEWTFTSRPDGSTFVGVREYGFKGSQDEVVKRALDSTGGFTLHIAGLKALLEHDLELNLTGDRHPR